MYQEFNQSLQDLKPNISKATKIEPTSCTFLKDIQMMMHGFGDVAQPLLETAKIIQQFVHEQICCYLFLAAEVAQQRGSCKIGIEEIMFLFRHNIPRLFHFMRHLNFRDSKGSLKKSSIDFDFTVESLDNKSLKRSKICYQFLECIDQYFNLKTSFHNGDFNDIKIKRLKIAELLTRDMDLAQYSNYSLCRQISFGKRIKIFQEWFESELNHFIIKPSKYGWESLAYLAHETVAELIYLAVLTQADQHKKIKTEVEQVSCFDDYFLSFNKTVKQPVTPSHIRELIRRCYENNKPGYHMKKMKLLNVSDEMTQPFLVLV